MTATGPFFSVVIPVFNRAAMLSDALTSVLGQSDQDFEIVVVDDGSTDDPKAVVDGRGDDRVRFVRQCNRGGGAARNTGIKCARGRFIAFLDSDDRFLPHHLAAMRRLLDGTHDTAGYAPVVVDRGIGKTMLKPARAIAAGEDMATYLLADRGFVPTMTTVVPAAWAKRILYHEKLPAAEDTDFAIRLAFAGCRFVMAAAPGAIWNDRADPSRLSHGRKGEELAEWAEQLRSCMPARAYYGCLGWSYAKHVATRDPWRAFLLYADALRHGSYKPSLAVIVALQIFLPDEAYRFIADSVIASREVVRGVLSPGSPRRLAPPASPRPQGAGEGSLD